MTTTKGQVGGNGSPIPLPQALSVTDIDGHVAWFEQYTARYLEHCAVDKNPIQLKVDHSLRVLANATYLLESVSSWQLLEKSCVMGSERETVYRSTLLAALYHDIGRFEQYLQHGTFNDRISVNHGIWGTRILRMLCVLDNEPDIVRKQVLPAVAMHNRMYLPCGLSGELRFVSHVLRESDKLDIMSTVADYLRPGGLRNDVVTLDLEDSPTMWTESVARSVLFGNSICYTDMRYLNDFILLLCSWVLGLRFAASRVLVAKQGAMGTLVKLLPAKSKTLALVRNKIMDHITI